VTTLCSFVVGLAVVMLWKREDITLSMVLVGKIVTASVIMGLVVALTRLVIPTSNIITLPVLIGTGLLVYGFLGFVSGFVTKRDVKFVIKAI